MYEPDLHAMPEYDFTVAGAKPALAYILQLSGDRDEGTFDEELYFTAVGRPKSTPLLFAQPLNRVH